MKKLLFILPLLLAACVGRPTTTDCKPTACKPTGCESCETCPACPSPPECPQLECDPCPECPPPDDRHWMGQVWCADKIVWFGEATNVVQEEQGGKTVITLTDVSDGSKQIFLSCQGIFEVKED